MYSKVGYNARKPKNFNKNKAFPHRKQSILDDFEAIANDSHEEIVRGSQMKASVEISPRKQRLELQSINYAPNLRSPGRDGAKAARKSAPLFEDVKKNATPQVKQSTNTALGKDPRERASSAINMLKFRPNFNSGRNSAAASKPTGATGLRN